MLLVLQILHICNSKSHLVCPSFLELLSCKQLPTPSVRWSVLLHLDFRATPVLSCLTREEKLYMFDSMTVNFNDSFLVTGFPQVYGNVKPSLKTPNKTSAKESYLHYKGPISISCPSLWTQTLTNCTKFVHNCNKLFTSPQPSDLQIASDAFN